jgi:hypothetical protein
MNASANSALFLQSSALNILLPELTNCGSAETDDYTHMPQQDEIGSRWRQSSRITKTQNGDSDEGQKVSTMKVYLLVELLTART